MFRLLLTVMAGLLAEYYCHFPLVGTSILFIALITFYVLFYFLPLVIRFRLSGAHSISLHLLLFLSGILLIRNKNTEANQHHFSKNSEKGDRLLVRITEPPEEKPKTLVVSGKVNGVIKGKHLQNTIGTINIIVKKDTGSVTFDYGDVIVIPAKYRPISNPGNPGAFDKKKYYFFQQTYHQVYLKSSDIVLIERGKGSSIWQAVYLLKSKVLHVLQQHIGKSEGRLGIAEALLIGYRSDLDREVLQSYTNTGVVHIIAISGMHLGLIYLTLAWILKRLPFLKNKKWTKAIILLVCLWFFSLMTGASASVLRSAVMFTCIVVGEVLGRSSTIINSLAASAFLLLVYNPYFLWDVGFQLSYLAILGIVFFQKPLQQKLRSENKMLRKVTDMCAVTLAAQLMTFPVSLYYFHQFPVYFLFSNLLAIPLSTIILFEEILLLCLSSFSMLTHWLSQVIEFSISCMNRWISFVNEIPVSVINNIELDLQMTLLLYLSLFFLSRSFFNKNKKMLTIGFVLFFIFISLKALAFLKRNRQRQLVIYNIPGHDAFGFVNGRNLSIFADTGIIQDRKTIQFFIQPSFAFFGVSPENVKWSFIPAQPSSFSNDNFRMIVAGESVAAGTFQNSGRSNLLLLTGKTHLRISETISAGSPATVILSSSVALWKIVQLQKEADSLHLRCISITKEGALLARYQ